MRIRHATAVATALALLMSMPVAATFAAEGGTSGAAEGSTSGPAAGKHVTPSTAVQKMAKATAMPRQVKAAAPVLKDNRATRTVQQQHLPTKAAEAVVNTSSSPSLSRQRGRSLP